MEANGSGFGKFKLEARPASIRRANDAHFLHPPLTGAACILSTLSSTRQKACQSAPESDNGDPLLTFAQDGYILAQLARDPPAQPIRRKGHGYLNDYDRAGDGARPRDGGCSPCEARAAGAEPNESAPGRSCSKDGPCIPDAN